MKVLLSIKPKFAEKIFNGIKKYEYRKAIFKNPEISKIVVYASSPIKKIIGEIEIEKIIFDTPNALWNKTSINSGVNKKFFFAYFVKRKMGYAIKIKSVNKYKKPINPHNVIDNFCAPQSFMYLKSEF
ncbi:ASCH domain-containing protein [Candidatus Latescibacterota bacterium]